jgi:putative ABC transport system ATP-binding protein
MNCSERYGRVWLGFFPDIENHLLDHNMREGGRLFRPEPIRVAIGRAMLRPGGLILADEPTGSLDARMAATVMDSLVSATHDAGKTLVVVTHDMGMAAKCGRILHMSGGTLA